MLDNGQLTPDWPVDMYGQQKGVLYSMQTAKLIGIPVCSGSDAAVLAGNNAISPCPYVHKDCRERCEGQSTLQLLQRGEHVLMVN
jgi:hypothetical protein